MFWSGLNPDEAREYLEGKDKSKYKRMTLSKPTNFL